MIKIPNYIFYLLVLLLGIVLVFNYYSKSQTTVTSYNPEVKIKFDEIYDTFRWGRGGGGSGHGSTLDSTRDTRNIIYQTINEYDINSMIDASCGAMVWMPYLLENITQTRPNFRYHGVDVVEKIINASKIKFADKKNWKFSALDFTQQPLPNGYDMIHSRDTLMHLPLLKAIDAIKIFSNAKNMKYLLIGTYLEANVKNVNIKVGDYYPINLLISPFNLTGYIKKFVEYSDVDFRKKHLLLFDVENYLKKIDFDAMKREAAKME